MHINHSLTINIDMKRIFFLLVSGMLAVASMAQKACKVNPPVMGWSSWNTLALNINEENICANADAQVSSGLRDAGYVYCNIDDGFMGGRDADGNILYNKKLFPHGMKFVADYIRSKGLIPGIYNDAAGNTCGSGSFETPAFGQGVGLYGYEEKDCKTYFLDWGYDFIKVDYCGAAGMRLQEQPTYTAIGNAIKATGKKVSYNICRWAFPGIWCSQVADSWRISGDINISWGSLCYVIGKNRYLSAYCGGGHYNDMDMLEIGQGLPLNEEEVHMGMWCIQSSPLLVGCDMTKIPEQSLELMKNKELIAINQDRLGLQAYIVSRVGNTYVYVKDIEELNGNTRAVALLNLGDQEAEFNLPLSEIDMKGTIKVRDLIKHKNEPSIKGNINTTVPAHSIKVWKVKGKRIERTKYNAGTAFMPLFNDLGKNPEIIRYSDNGKASCGVAVRYLGNSPQNVMKWKNVYTKKGGKYDIAVSYSCSDERGLFIDVNGKRQYANGLNSGSGNFKDVVFTANLNPGNNIITIGNDYSWAPDIDGITLTRK